MVVLGLFVIALAATVGYVLIRKATGPHGPRPPRWWAPTATGAATLVIVFGLMAVPWPDSWRVPGAFLAAFFGIVTALLAIATGLLLGAVRWVEVLRARA